MNKTSFSSRKAFILSGFFASALLISAPLYAVAGDLALAGAPHPSDIQPEIAKKVAPEKQLRSNLTDAETQLKETESALIQTITAHKKGQATADEVSTHVQMLGDNISALDDKIKAIKAAPKSKTHAKWIKEGNAAKEVANRILEKAPQN